MPTLEAFFSAAKSIVSLGAKANAENRAEIRNVVGSLSDELDRGLALADAYLGGALVIRDNAELEQYLVAAYPKIMRDFAEYKVCSALYQLSDEFRQLFSTKRLSVSVTELSEVRELVDHLRYGERAVIDSLDAILQGLSTIGFEIGSANPRKQKALKLQAKNAVLAGRVEITALRKRVKSLARKITEKM